MKSLAEPSEPSSPAPDGAPRAMARDPICDVYIPVAKAHALTRAGETHYFCSTACQERYERRAAS